MKIGDVDPAKEEKGDYCRKGASGCFCAVGYPYEKQCPDCRDTRDKNDNMDYCVCPPVERIFKR